MSIRAMRIILAFLCCAFGLLYSACGAGFEGKIHAIGGRTGATSGLMYTVGTNCMRVEMTDTNFPNAIDLLDMSSGEITLVQPMNRTFLKFNPNNRPTIPGRNPGGPTFVPPPMPMPAMQPGMSPGASAGIGPTNLPGMPAPAMRALPEGVPPGIGPQAGMAGTPAVQGMQAGPGMNGMMMHRRFPGMQFQLQATDGQTNLLGYECRRYLIQQHGETMEIWATDGLRPFQVYLPNQPPGFGMPMMEFEWSRLLAGKKLFPLYATLRGDNGAELYHFEVQSIAAGSLTKNEIQNMQPPGDYVEIQPRPF